MTSLPSIKREYTLYEIATMTRAAPRKLYGFNDRGELGPGAVADIVVYKPQRDKAGMFRNAAYMFKDGDPIVRDGKVSRYTRGRRCSSSRYDRQVNKRLELLL